MFSNRSGKHSSLQNNRLEPKIKMKFEMYRCLCSFLLSVITLQTSTDILDAIKLNWTRRKTESDI